MGCIGLMVGEAGRLFQLAEDQEGGGDQGRDCGRFQALLRFVFHTVERQHGGDRFMCQPLILNAFWEGRKGGLKTPACQSMSVMPTLENKLPEVNHRTLTRRAARSQAVVGIARATLPGQMVLRLRRSAETMGELVENPAAPAEERIAAARAMVTLQDQLIDLLGIPRRPASAAAGKGKPSAPILDVSPSAAPPDLG
jgi:hypothetical protein